MITILWKKLKNYFYELNFSLENLITKLDDNGLETKIIKKNEEIFLEFNPLPNREDLFSKEEIIREISIITECSLKKSFLFNNNFSKEEKIIEIDQNFINKKLGEKLNHNLIKKTLKKMNFSFTEEINNQKKFFVKIPYYRIDINKKIDLLEEIAKVYGYENIGNKNFFNENNFVDINNNYEDKKRKIEDYLINWGFQELITYSLISSEIKKKFSKDDNNFYYLINSKNKKYFRHIIFPSHLDVIYRNISHKNNNLFFFEIANVYKKKKNNIFEEEILTLSFTGKIFNQYLHNNDSFVDFYWVKGFLENILDLWNLENEIFFSNNDFHFLSFFQRADINLREKKIGFLGKIDSKILKDYNLTEPVFILELSFTKLFSFIDKNLKICYSNNNNFFSNYPISEKDISLIFSEDIDYKTIIKKIEQKNILFLKKIEIFDIYRNEEMIIKEEKSVTFRLIIQNFKKTLENKEIEKVIFNVIELLEKEFNAKKN